MVGCSRRVSQQENFYVADIIVNRLVVLANVGMLGLLEAFHDFSLPFAKSLQQWLNMSMA
jgi:hypothetical protein